MTNTFDLDAALATELTMLTDPTTPYGNVGRAYGLAQALAVVRADGSTDEQLYRVANAHQIDLQTAMATDQTQTTPKRPGPATTRLDAEAVALATQWVTERKAVRLRLIAMARANHPERPTQYGDDHRYKVVDGVPNNTIRKLYRYPADLTDATLLELATTKW